MWTSSLDFLRLSTSSCSTTSDPPLSSFDRVLVSCLSPWNVHTAVITQLQASTQVCQQRCFGVLMFKQHGHWEKYIIYINQIKSNVGRFSVCVLCSWGECGQAVVCDHGHASSKAVNYHAITALEQCVTLCLIHLNLWQLLMNKSRGDKCVQVLTFFFGTSYVWSHKKRIRCRKTVSISWYTNILLSKWILILKHCIIYLINILNMSKLCGAEVKMTFR